MRRACKFCTRFKLISLVPVLTLGRLQPFESILDLFIPGNMLITFLCCAIFQRQLEQDFYETQRKITFNLI